MFSYHSLPGFFKQGITEKGEDESKEFLDLAVASSLPIDFPITPQELIELHRVYEPYTFKRVPSRGFQTPRDHLIPSIGMDIAELVLNKFTNDCTLSIGTRFNRISEFQHNCYDLDGRDEARIRKHLNRQFDKELHEFMLTGKHSRACPNGVQNCAFQATNFIMNNVYDVSLKQICIAFGKHNFSIGYAAMILPDALVYNITDHESDFGYTIRKRENGKVEMSFGTGALSYIHDYKEWREWCISTGYKHNGVSIQVERVNTIGPMTILQITRTLRPNKAIATYYPRTRQMKIFDYSKHSFWLGLKARLPFCNASKIREYLEENAPSFMVPQVLYDSIVKQGMVRPDENFTRQNLALHLKATTSRIVINSEVLQGGVYLTAGQFSALLISAYIDSAVMRQEQTRTIGNIITILRGESTFDRYCTAFISGCKGVLPVAKNLASNAAESLAYGLQVKEVLETGRFKSGSRKRPEFIPRVRHEDWFAYTEDGRCVNETKAYLRAGNKAYSKQYNEHLEMLDDEQANFRVQNGHAQPLLNPERYCDHAVGYKQSIPYCKEHYETKQFLKIYHRYETDPNTDDNVTTHHKLAKFLDSVLPMSSIIKTLGLGVVSKWHKKRVALLCAGPGGDLVQGIGAVNITPYSPDQTSVKAGVCAKRVYEGLNICCPDCVSTIAESILYCDLGAGISQEELLSTQYTALLNLLSTGKSFGLKLQSFMKSVCMGEPLAYLILDLARKHSLYFYNVGNANELFVQNIVPTRPIRTLRYLPDFLDLRMCIKKLPKPVVHQKTPPFDIDEEGLPDLWAEPPGVAPLLTQNHVGKKKLKSKGRIYDISIDGLPNLWEEPDAIKPGMVSDFTSAMCATRNDECMYAAVSCATTASVIKTDDVPDQAIIRSDCKYDEDLIRKAIGEGLHVIRRKINFCQGCELANMIHYRTFAIAGEDIVPGTRKKIPEIAFKKVALSLSLPEQTEILSMLKKELKSSSGSDYDDVNRRAEQQIATLQPRGNIELHGVVGCPGSGKTRFAMANIPQDCVVITPYKRLTEEYRQYGFKSRTFISGLDRQYDCVLLDEVYAFSPGVMLAYLLKSKVVYAIGDPRQMSNVDEKKIYKGNTVSKIIPWGNLPQLTVSYTLPIDSTYLLNKYYGYDISTLSTKLFSHKAKDWRLFNGEYNCFTTAHERNNIRAKTVAKIQGTRAKEIQLLLEPHAKALIQECPGQFVVAISRHTEQLSFSAADYGSRILQDRPSLAHTCEPKGLESFYFKGAQYDFNEVSFRERQAFEKGLGYEVKLKREAGHAVVPEVVPAMQTVTQQCLTDASIPTNMKVKDRLDILFPEPDAPISIERGYSLDHVQQILSRIAPTLNQHECYYGVTTNEFETEGQLQINNIEALAFDRGMYCSRLPVPLYGRPTMITSASQSLHTILKRYVKANYRKNLKQVHAEKLAADMFDTFMTKVVSRIELITEEDISMGFAEFVNKMVTRARALPLSVLDADESRLYTEIEGFLKQQNKADLNIEAWIRYENGSFKAGQGIAAQCKNVNILAAAYIRAFEKKLKQCLQQGVYLVNGMSDRELALVVQQNYRQDTECIGIDIKEFDTVHDKSTEFFMWKVYGAFGVPKFVYRLIGSLNFDWILSYVMRDSDFPITMKAMVHDKMQSGRPDTLIKNSVVALVLVLKSIAGSITSIYSKGDDVNVQGRNLRLIYDEPCLKIDRQQPPSFVGYIIADKLTLDIPRLCVKLLNRNYASEASISDYIVAVKDWLKVIRGDEGKVHAAEINAKRYGISADECAYLLGFMFEFADGKILSKETMNQLVKVRLDKFVLSRSETSV